MKNKNKGGGIVGGFVLIAIGIVCLWWNEGRTAKQIALLKEAKANYVQLDSTKINKDSDKKLVALNGKMDLSGSEDLIDEEFGIKVHSAKLYRQVEMYQWDESCTTRDNGTQHCTYDKEWSSTVINSSTFHEKNHENPASMLFESNTVLATNVKLGEFRVPGELVKNLSTKEVVKELSQEAAANKNMKISSSGDMYTNSQDEANPQIGDHRIKFYKNNATDISIMAVQTGDTFSAYTAKNGNTLMVIREGNMTGAQIIADLVKSNNFMKWLFRLLGFLAVTLGISSLFSFLTNLTSRIPILGSLVGGTVFLVALVLGLAISLIVCAIAWFRFRPIISLILIVIALVVFVILKFVLNKKESVEAKK